MNNKNLTEEQKKIAKNFYGNLWKGITHLLNPRYFDIADWILLISNILVIYYAITQHFGVITVMWIYWFQSIIIGFFTVMKILALKKFSTKGLTINNKLVEENKQGKIKSVFIFILVYGIFHIAYLFFLLEIGANQVAETFSFTLIIIPVIIFFINHLFSFIYNYKEDSNKKRNIGEIIAFPILRIFPMHFTIIFGWFFLDLFSSFGISLTIPVLIFFLFLKTLLDIYMHRIEHHNPQIKEYSIDNLKRMKISN